MARSPQPDGEEGDPLTRELDYNPPMVVPQDAGFYEADFPEASGRADHALEGVPFDPAVTDVLYPSPKRSERP